MALTDTGVKHVTAGVPTAQVTIKAGETFVDGDLVGYNAGWVLADASTSIAARYVAFRGGVAGDIVPVGTRAHVTGTIGATTGGVVYLGESGKFSESPGVLVQAIGLSTSATESDIEIKLPTTVGSTDITDGAVVNADVNAAAAIALSKLAGVTTGHVVVGVGGAASSGTIANKALLANTKVLIGDAAGVAQEFALSSDVTMTAGGAVTIAADAVTTAKILNANVTPAKLKATLQTGVIPIPLQAGRVLSGGAIQNLAAYGGMLASDSAPILALASGVLRASWANTVVAVLQWGGLALPPDCAASGSATFNMIAAMAGAADTPTVTVGIYDKAGNSLGGATGAVTGATYAEYTRTFAIPAHPDTLSVSLTPSAHNTDALYVIGCWIEYPRA